MIGYIIRKFSVLGYKHPRVLQDRGARGYFGQLKVALIADYFTAVSLAQECRVLLLTPENYRDALRKWRPDLVFVESAFHGVGEEWRYKIGRQPLWLRLFPSREIPDLVSRAQELDIPSLFWNKDDKAFFDVFIDAAKNFKYVFTTDSDCLADYRRLLPEDSYAGLLAMPYQPAFHNFTGFNFRTSNACFVGSYYRKILNNRRNYLDMVFEACAKTHLSVNVYDRNSSRYSHFFEFRYPQSRNLAIHRGVPYPETAKLYKNYAISINVNSIIDSPTMISRRFLEILACGGICVTNANPAIRREFSEFCHIVNNSEEAAELLARLSKGPARLDLEMAEAGARHVAKRHTWARRLEELAEIMGF